MSLVVEIVNSYEQVFPPASPRLGYDVAGGYYRMTTDDIRRQKVDLTIQIEDAEHRLAGLREAATRRANAIIKFATRLKTSPELQIYRQGHSAIHGQPLDKIELLTDSDIEVLQLMPSLEIANSIRREMEDIASLKGRLAKLV